MFNLFNEPGGPVATSLFIRALSSSFDRLRYGSGRTRKRTLGKGWQARQKEQEQGGKSKGKDKTGGDGGWSAALSAVQDLARVARRVVEGKHQASSDS